MRTKGLKPERVCWRGAVINALLKNTSGPPRSRRPMPSGFQAKNRVWIEPNPAAAAAYLRGSRWRLRRPPIETALKTLLVPQVA